MKVLLTRPFLKGDLDYISGRINENVTLIDPGFYSEESLLNYVKEADVLFGNFFTERMIIAAENLKFIQIPWTGVENLDFELLRKYNITVCNSHSNAAVVAEHAVALMLDAAKKLSYHDRLLRMGKWNRVTPGKLNEISPFSVSITGSKIGIIGFGSIGQKIFKMLNSFESSFKVFDRKISDKYEMAENLKQYTPEEICSELYDLDFVFVAVPLTDETRQLIDKKFFSAMKPESVLINISRGEIINESDLYFALKNRTISFAGIDTWFNYPSRESPDVFPSARYEFHLLDNVVLSPHRAGYVDGAYPHLDDAIENLNRYYAGKPLKNIISLINKY